MEDGKIINKLLELDERLHRIQESMLTKEDGEKITTTLDYIVKVVESS